MPDRDTRKQNSLNSYISTYAHKFVTDWLYTSKIGVILSQIKSRRINDVEDGWFDNFIPACGTD